MKPKLDSGLVLFAGLLLLLVLGAGVVTTVLAQEDAPAVGWWVLGGGGGSSGSDDVALYDTLGQSVGGPSSDGDVSLAAGFWAGMPALPTTHVQVIHMRYWSLGAWKLVLGLVRIVGESNLPIGGASVTGKWTLPNGYPISRQAQTRAGGWSLFWMRTPQTGIYQFCVTDVMKDGYAYDPDQNQETCDAINVP